MKEVESVVVGLSGGVDSSVAALLLVEQGYRVQGLFMRNWEDDDTDTVCTAEQDLADVRQVCAQLDIPLHQVNFADRYRQQVFDDCLREFQAGRTPNPDVLCNREIKFRAFLDHARRLGADYVATGHYARLGRDEQGRATLLRGVDAGKDQSYFLYMVGHQALARTLFPVGEMDKHEVRALAEEAGFDNFEKKDSTGICFIGERDFRDFLQRYIATEPGPMVTPEGRHMGEHQGLSFYTLGQRQGLGIGGRADSAGKPWYVVDKDLRNNTLVVAQGGDHPALFSPGLVATDLHWVAGEPPTHGAPLRCTAKIRYRQPDQSCTLRVDGDRAVVTFQQPQRAVTPGQSVVFYQGEQCLGGGIIEHRLSGDEAK